jgi:hypothetical protein
LSLVGWCFGFVAAGLLLRKGEKKKIKQQQKNKRLFTKINVTYNIDIHRVLKKYLVWHGHADYRET